MSAIRINAEPVAGHITGTFLQMAAGVAQLLSQTDQPIIPAKPSWTIKSSSKAVIPVKNWLSEVSENLGEVQRLCQEAQTMHHLVQAVELAKRHFPGRHVSIRAVQDPEGEGEWLDVDVALNDRDADPLSAYRRCIGEWVRSTTPNARELIHFTFHFD
jgi:hypothetical protein